MMGRFSSETGRILGAVKRWEIKDGKFLHPIKWNLSFGLFHEFFCRNFFRM